MKFSLIICTYLRSQPLLKLLQSVNAQTQYPSEIIIVDGSLNQETKEMLEQNPFQHLNYFLVSEEERGLTRQRNYGIARVGNDMEIVCFLDDDTVLEPEYFEQLLKTYQIHPEALGVGGYINNEIPWKKVKENEIPKIDEFSYDGWKRKDGSRFVLRKKLGLIDATPPGFLPIYSHGRSVGFLPPSGNTYSVEFFMGGVSSFRKSVFDALQFSTYFEGYGLYEDLDFCLRVSKMGNLYVNTSAKLEHHHEESGRPNYYKYGKMVVVNGRYVWRVKYPKPTLKATLLFHLNIIVLMKIRFLNSFYGTNKMQIFKESVGRFVGWVQILIKK